VVAAVGREVGLLHAQSKIILGDEFEKMNQTHRDQAAQHYAAFARVTPSQKYAIVQALQKKYVVEFLGDGINDVPVLKLADVGIAVQGSVDIAQAAADVILLEKSLNGIIDGIAAGRTALVNAKKYLLGTLSLNMSNAIGLVILSLLVPFLPVLPSQLLLMHSLADIPMFALAVDKVEATRLARPTRFYFFPLMVLLLGFALAGSCFTISFFALFRDHPLTELRAVWFSMGVLMSLVLLFSARSYVPIWRASRPSRWLMFSSAAVAVIALLIPQISSLGALFGFTKPHVFLLLQATGIVITCLILIESVKYLLVRILGLQKNG
jgi:Mg2+-importing ATPase